MQVIQPVDAKGARLERALKETIQGEVRFDAKSRLLYSTDASLYQILPVGVVVPKDAEDVAAATRLAAEAGVPVLPRGGGTALAGQTVGPALVLDFGKYMNRVLEIDPDRRTARVQPGLRLDRLNRIAAPHKLHFGPDPATIRQCCLGGMIGNNSCGARSLVYGKTGDHVHTLDCILGNGASAHFGPVARDRIGAMGGVEGELARRVLAVLEPERARIIDRYPKVPRRVSGYNFDAMLEAPELNLAHLIVGSEGTLATVVEATVGLVPVPPARALVLLSFSERFTSMDATPFILPEPGLSALEIVDSRVLQGARDLFEFRPTAALVAPDAMGVLFCEFSGDTADEVAERAHDFARRAPSLPGRPTAGVFLSAAEQNAAWALRQAATGLLYRTTSHRDIKPQEFVEDTGIAPEKLGAYTRRFEEIVHRNGTTLGFFGHAGQACLHIRVDLNLKRGEDVHRMQAIAHEVAELVAEFGGSLSGEHGDGLSRSEFLPIMFGPEIMDLHRQVKQVFDPENRMNPGKIVPPVQRMSENLRFGESYRANPPQTWFDYSNDGGDFAVAVEKCNGMGVCRKLDAGTMCPSFMVTLEEQHSTRGRANSLREAMKGNLPGMRSHEVLEALDLCLSCKACKTECPVGVDMARYKAEFLAQHHREHGTDRKSQFFGRIHDVAKAASIAPGFANFGNKMFSGLIKQVGGIDPRREMPTFAPQPFRKWFRGINDIFRGEKPTVILLDDTFNNFFGPEPLKAAAFVLTRAGFNVKLPQKQVCCGRAAISKGLLDHARDLQQNLVDVLAPEVEAGAMVVGIEPSCILTLRDELPDLVRDGRTKALAAASLTLEEFLAGLPDWKPGRLERRAVVHGHCHQKAIVGMEPTRQVLSRVEGLEFTILDSGCCGMAGSFGYEQGHYEVSRAAGERVLFPAVRAAGEEALVVAPGFSCRHQIADFCDNRRSLHTAELLAMAK
ncbi:FAD-binding and (Fe-S)-binding domain-containing protein [Longimicrobium sp.]|uniref:FAD-binding and (Fe-S)-binding domain-containing protein n=1 Tax=Longimicrobium sp. TaxID=2029185 RepID=UPI002E365266|nr:FAD-binding and (Fe-S)-binding domain-containing protein [Longimicrobium sp.]HEX6038557.1 FAD-binding and (Fe-S)-binding domain-containing protein [Longimicrobium sp.]